MTLPATEWAGQLGTSLSIDGEPARKLDICWPCFRAIGGFFDARKAKPVPT